MRSLALFLAYLGGLVGLVATSRREVLREALFRRGLLLPPPEASAEGNAEAEDRGRCRQALPVGRGVKLHAGTGLGNCLRCVPGDVCVARYLALDADGTLALHDGADASSPVLWEAASRKWFWANLNKKKAAYWAEFTSKAVTIGRGARVVVSRPLADCEALLEWVQLSPATDVAEARCLERSAAARRAYAEARTLQ
ncbi:hypothetical protein M885DRAFT_529403 [Pelagophyceae sp. CCMP2097]|nr:hypothetical protein M885DRAFT_529403 [Pelagophyceae sp. CCMP2097]